MEPRHAELIESREILPGQWLQTYRAPWIAAAARSGQYVHLQLPVYPPPVMRQPHAINTYDRVHGTVSIHFLEMNDATSTLAQLRPGQLLDMTGPLGRPFEVDQRTRHVLLIASETSIAGIRALADEGIAANRQVTLAYGARTPATVYPSSLLPDEVEYVVATADGSFGQRGAVTDLLPQLEAWADQAFASGPYETITALAQLASGRRTRLGVAALGSRRSRQARRRAWLQVALEQNIGCAVGTCLGCVIMGVAGPKRVCREGPVFASDEIAWDARWP